MRYIYPQLNSTKMLASWLDCLLIIMATIPFKFLLWWNSHVPNCDWFVMFVKHSVDVLSRVSNPGKKGKHLNPQTQKIGTLQLEQKINKQKGG